MKRLLLFILVLSIVGSLVREAYVSIFTKPPAIMATNTGKVVSITHEQIEQAFYRDLTGSLPRSEWSDIVDSMRLPLLNKVPAHDLAYQWVMFGPKCFDKPLDRYTHAICKGRGPDVFYNAIRDDALAVPNYESIESRSKDPVIAARFVAVKSCLTSKQKFRLSNLLGTRIEDCVKHRVFDHQQPRSLVRKRAGAQKPLPELVKTTEACKAQHASTASRISEMGNEHDSVKTAIKSLEQKGCISSS